MEYIPDEVEGPVAVGLVAESVDFVAESVDFFASVERIGTQSYILSPPLPLRNFVPPKLVSMIWPCVHSVRLEGPDNTKLGYSSMIHGTKQHRTWM